MKGIKFLKKLSLLPQGLRYKLLIAFSLMSIIPLLVIGYLANTLIFLEEKVSFNQVSVIALFCIIIAWLGLFLAKRIIERVIDVALESKIITEGNYERKVYVDTGDEIGQIGEAINFLTKKIKSNISDLKDYQSKMKEINLDIQRKVLVLSNLLQIGELISSTVEIGAILELVLAKLSQLCESGFAALYLAEEGAREFTLRSSHNLENEKLLTAKVTEGKGLLGKAVLKSKYTVVDASSKFSTDEQEFKTKYKCENIVAYPIRAGKWARALLVVGNDIKNVTYTNDDVGIIKVFAEQISIAIENDSLIKKAERLQIKEERTGLFNMTYIINRLNEEIQRSIISQRPCAFMLLDLDDFKEYQEKRGQTQAEIALKKIAHVVNEFAMPVGKAGLIDNDMFALILPEVNKKGALAVAEKLRKKIETLELSSEKGDTLTASGGVSENPLDGANADEIFDKAKKALSQAKQKGKNKIVSSGV